MTKHEIVKFIDFHCRKCGCADCFVYESKESICIKCEDCNERYIFSINDRREGAVTELKAFKEYFAKDLAKQTYLMIDMKEHIEFRLKELEKP